MCGLFGGRPELLVKNAEAALRHRGPDQQGRQNFLDATGTPLTLGMTRLKVVDHRDIPVPFAFGDSLISFNGEIYNWRALRAELEKDGVRFETENDVELALHAFLHWGPDCLHRFNGMFALAIWHDGRFFLARDRVGKKPLFVSTVDGGIAFASEIKALQQLEYRHNDICDRLEFFFGEHTAFDNVTSLNPGEYMTWDSRNGRIERRRWWQFPDFEGTIEDPDEAREEFLTLMRDACQTRMIADFPVTMFLSGGVDSSLIQSLVNVKHTYTVQFTEFEKTINEVPYVSEFAEKAGFEFEVIRPDISDFLQCFPDLAWHIEQPVGSFSIFPLYCLSRQARRDGYRVALSGEGADELFNGYYRNEMLLQEDSFAGRHIDGPYKFLAQRYFGSRIERLARMATRHGDEDIEALIGLFDQHWNEDAPFFYNISKIETEIFLQPLLTMADRMSMANSFEVRNPFLDHRVIEFSARLAGNLKYDGKHGKAIVRDALYSLHGDSLALTSRKIKHGLPAPVNNWLFKSNDFDRQDWNTMIFGECLIALRTRHLEK